MLCQALEKDSALTARHSFGLPDPCGAKGPPVILKAKGGQGPTTELSLPSLTPPQKGGKRLFIRSRPDVYGPSSALFSSVFHCRQFESASMPLIETREDRLPRHLLDCSRIGSRGSQRKGPPRCPGRSFSSHRERRFLGTNKGSPTLYARKAPKGNESDWRIRTNFNNSWCALCRSFSRTRLIPRKMEPLS